MEVATPASRQWGSQSMARIDKGNSLRQSIRPCLANTLKSMLTTPATTLPGSFAQLVPSDREPITKQESAPDADSCVNLSGAQK